MSEKLHVAICQVVAIMNVTVMSDPDLIRSHDILRVALIDYADKPDADLVKLENYEKALGRIAEGDPTPMLVARAVLGGAKWDVK